MRKIHQKVTFLLLALIVISCNKDYTLMYPKPQVSLSNVSLKNETTIVCYTVSYVEDATISPILDYGICYSSLNANPTIVDDYSISLMDRGNSVSTFTLNGLTKDAKYYVRAYATNKGGTEYSDTKNIFTNTNIATLGGNCWVLTNLYVSVYSDGTTIPEVKDTSWKTLTTGAWRYYNPSITAYGKLYNWYAVMGIYDNASLLNPALRKTLAPENYHIASLADWDSLNTLKFDDVKFRTELGGRIKETGTANQLGFQANWWCKGNANKNNVAIYFHSDNSGLTKDSIDVKLGFSLRCIRDN